MLFSTVFLTSCLLLMSNAASNLDVPTQWTATNTTLTYEKRISISKQAIDTMNSQALKGSEGPGLYDGIGYWQTGSTFSALINHDRFAGTKDFKDLVLKNLKDVWQSTKFYKFECYNDDALWFATASFSAWKVYGDSDALSYATTVWDKVVPYIITDQVAKSGKISTKDFTVKGSCDSRSMVGGVFWRNNKNDASVNTITTSLFATLSAYLADTTGDDKYKNAAISSFTWLKDVNTDADYLLRDTVHGDSCERDPHWKFTYNSGKTIEGLSLMEKVTGNNAWTKYLNNVVAAVAKTDAWQGKNGIITEGGNTSKNDDGSIFKSIFIRGLTEAYAHSQDAEVKKLIRAYIDVQYNSLLNTASKDGNMYSNAWAKAYPSDKKFFAWGQAAALDVLAGSIWVNHV